MRHPVLSLILAGLAAEACTVTEGTACVEVGEGVETCPSVDEADPDEMWTPGQCGVDVGRLLAQQNEEPEVRDTDLTGPRCCYDAKIVDSQPGMCVVGRPYPAGAGCAVDGDEAGAVGGWTRMAYAEHASVAAFARLTLQLMALGAPLPLLADVQAAAADEVRHARRCAEVVRALGGPAVAFGAFDVGAPEGQATLASVGAAALAEGCFGETLAALVALEAAAGAEGLAAEVLAEIAADEARHAQLSWRIAAWALRVGGEPVRCAMRDVAPVLPGPAVDDEDSRAAGLLGPAATRAVVERGYAEVVRPALLALGVG
jgi:hypothetical protein